MNKPLEKDRVNEVIEAVMKVARGNYSVQIKLSGENDELDALGIGLNMMIDDIREHITELKRAEEERREAAATRERAVIIDVMHDSLVLLSLSGKIIYANPAHIKMFGHKSMDEIGGKSIEGFKECFCDPEKDASKFLDLFNMIIEKGFCEPIETTFRKKDGEVFVVSASGNLLRDAGGNPKSVIIILRGITERKKAEQALHESLERYRSFIEVTGDLGWTTNPDGEVVEDIPSFRNFTGQTYEETKGWGWLKALHPDDLERIERIWKEATRTRRKYEVEYRLRRHDGVYRYFLARGIPMLGEDGSIREWVGTCIDITERKQAEEALKESEEKYRNLFDNANDVILISDLKGKVTSANKAVEEYGFKKDDVVGKNMLELVPKKQWSRILKDSVKAARGKRVAGETEAITPKGKRIIEYSGNLIRRGKKAVGTLTILRDITERKEMEEKLRQYSEHLEELVQKRTAELLESEKRYSVLVEEASDGILMVQDGKTIFANKKFSEICGYPKDELMELPFEKLVDEKYRRYAKDRYLRVLQGETVLSTFEIELVAKTGARVPVELNARGINYQGCAADLLIARDIRERKRMEEQRLELERLSAIGEMATMVAHDLRNPLQSIENAIYYINSELANLSASVLLSPKSRQMFQVINDSVNYADKIVGDLRDFSATITPKFKKINVNKIVKETLQQTRIPNNVKLHTEIGQLPEIEVDEDQIKRVFINLTTNGIQTMENGGGTLTVSTKQAEGFIEITFKDTGTGIPKEHVEKLFTPFFTTKAKGIGMGLAICQKFVKSHGGSIKVESEAGKGSTFKVRLPVFQRNGGEKLDQG
jgi:PAS domain S-box-containing protein